jgi:uncharacterized protein (TIGR02246 family)
VPLSVEDQLAIHKLYADYCFAIDDGDGPTFAACFTADGTLDAGHGDPVNGSDALVAFAPAIAGGFPGLRHVTTNVSFDGNGAEATGRAYLSVYHTTAEGHRVLSAGRYIDALRRVDGRWHFASREVAHDRPS